MKNKPDTPPTPSQPSGTGEEKKERPLVYGKYYNEGEEEEKEVTAMLKDTCPINGQPLKTTLTTSPSAGHREHQANEQKINREIEQRHGLKEGSVIETAPYKGHRDSEEIGSAKQWETTAYEVGEQLLQAQRNYNSLYDQTTKDATAFKQTIALQAEQIKSLNKNLDKT